MRRERPGQEAAAQFVVSAETGLHPPSGSLFRPPGDGAALRQILRQGDYTDILIVADDAELSRLDTDAEILPLARTMGEPAIPCLSRGRRSGPGSPLVAAPAASSPPGIRRASCRVRVWPFV